MTLSSKVSVRVQGRLTSAQDLAVASVPLDLSMLVSLVDGTAPGQANRLFADTRTLAGSATEDLDLAGALTDALGGPFTLAKLKAVVVRAWPANTNNVVVSRPAANGVPLFAAASDAIAVQPGGMFVWAAPGAGVVVTAGTGDLLTLTNSAGGTPVSYDVVLIGASA